MNERTATCGWQRVDRCAEAIAEILIVRAGVPEAEQERPPALVERRRASAGKDGATLLGRATVRPRSAAKACCWSAGKASSRSASNGVPCTRVSWSQAP